MEFSTESLDCLKCDLQKIIKERIFLSCHINNMSFWPDLHKFFPPPVFNMFFIQYTAAVITLDSELQERSSNMGGWVSQNTHICVKHN